MKTKRILLGIGLFVMLAFIGGGVFMFKFHSETSKMTPVATGRITGDCFAVQDEFVNMYFLQEGTKYIAIDAGKDLHAIEQELHKLNIRADDVIAVFLTHTDMDHVAALPLFKNAKLYLAGAEIKMLNGEKQKIPLYNNSISRTDYTLLEDRQTVTIGSSKIQGILTEGHTSGSMCYQVNDKYLFTGDILSLHNGKVGPSVEFFDLDHNMASKAIAKIANLSNVECILTSHFGISRDYKYAVKDWKE